MTIHKLCIACSRYFSGEMNGEYLCPECRESVGMKARPLAALDSIGPDCPPVSEVRPAAKGRAA